MPSLRPRHRLRRGLRWGIVTCAAVAVTVALLWSLPAAARHTRWSHPLMRVYNPTGWQITTRIAADAWNRTGITPRIVFVSSRAEADILIDASTFRLRRLCGDDCTGHASRSTGLILLEDPDPELDRTVD